MKNTKKLLFVGSVQSEKMLMALSDFGLSCSYAANTFQTSLLNGLAKYCEIKSISELFIPTWPKVKATFIKSEEFCTGGIKCESISFINLPFLKKISQIVSCYGKIKKNAKDTDTIIIYELTSRRLIPAVLAGKSVRKIVIVPDLPEYMSANTNPLYLFAKKIDKLLIDWTLKHVDGFVLFSPYMKEKINIGGRPWITVEGVFSTADIVPEQEKTSYRVLLYTGKIEKWFGLEDLLEAFVKIKGDEYRLWLCGSGDIDMINRYSKMDRRIIYRGSLPHYKILELQKQATVLVNPRHSYDEFTMYSFPSKTMEYMASGTPTLMCPLKCLPKDYLSYLLLFEDESIDGMSERIKNCLNMEPDKLRELGLKASHFILSNKTADSQARKIVDTLL